MNAGGLAGVACQRSIRLRETHGDRRAAAPAPSRADREVQPLDVGGELLLERERHRLGEP